jgi:hypothetical protein
MGETHEKQNPLELKGAFYFQTKVEVVNDSLGRP